MPSCWKSARSAFNRNSFPITVRVLSRDRRMFDGETDVIRNKQVKVSITVVVQEAASRSPSRLVVQETRGLCYVGESAVTIVAVENVLAEVGTKNIFVTVVVVIPNAHAGGPTNCPEPRLFRNVCKRSVTIVLV